MYLLRHSADSSRLQIAMRDRTIAGDKPHLYKFTLRYLTLE